MKLNKLTASVGLAIGLMLGGVATTAQAGVTYFFPTTTFEDDNFDFFIDNDSNGVISVGDRLVSTFEITKTASPFGNAESGIGPQELTGVIDSIVAAKIPLFGGTFAFFFAPNPTSTYVNGAAGEVAKTWLDASPDLDVPGQNCVSLADCIAKATDGTPYLSVGFTGDADEVFGLTGTDNPSTVASGQAGVSFTSATFAFGIIDNQTGMNFGEISCFPNGLSTVNGSCNPLNPVGVGDGYADMVGGGVIKGGAGLTNGAFGRSDFDFDVAPIPEPGSLALIGVALLGLGVARKRARKSA